jgi:hypothetical protein
MNQHEWVFGCYQHYLENFIEPGNPEDGVWEKAHWPVPACKGGSKTVLLLKEHHAVHNVLQAEEWNYPCLYGWEAKYLSGELLILCKKWQGNKARLAVKRILETTTHEERSQRAKDREAARTPEQRRRSAKKGKEKMTPKQRRDAGLKGAASLTPEQKEEATRKRLLTLTPEERSDIQRKRAAKMTPERKSEIAIKAAANTDQKAKGEAVKKAHAKRSPEERSEATRKAWETRRKNSQ